MRQIALACIAAAIVVGTARAEEPDTAGGRYVLSKQDDGFLRLDTQSGAVSLCRAEAVGWACQAVPDDRALFEREIARLQTENAALKKILLTHGLALPPGAASETPSTQNAPSLRLPSDAEIDRMVAFVGELWQRFVDAVARAQKQMFNKS
jgi:hypothetical protein